ncbi:MAG TPA: M43 family zinc metalloprotease [Ferruginibacter sp.]|nr:M43 family zinc metalloprotease [Ferruginibacter sp.]HRE64246.1 M43 family zinc metalloprotease [Ferruginibacter sp.]
MQKQIEADPATTSRMQQIEDFTSQYIANRGRNTTEAVKTIPVVFHIIYNTAAQNISDARILGQLDVLNKDFAKLNADIGLVPSVFAPLTANTEIQFCLAQRDPTGLATTGIIRKSTTVTQFVYPTNNMKFTATGGSDAWPRDQYLNIWVCQMSGGILGFAQFPGGAANTDGVVLLTGSVGSVSSPGTTAPYHLGRTATHEVGHWLNLRHIWGDAFCGNDFVDDTPTQQQDNFGCPSFPHVTCSNGPNGDMFMNYMDYTNDACMYMFTLGQSVRMNALFATGGFREALLSSQGCLQPSGFNFNPTTPGAVTCGVTAAPSVSLGTTSNGGFTTPINLTASGVPAGTTVSFAPNPLTPGNATVVTLNNANTLANGTYNITVTGTAGSTVQTTTVSYVVSGGTAPTVATSPANQTVCAPATATFNVTASGAAVTSYQWQVNTGTGFTNIAGASSASYTTVATTAAMNGYQYRVLLNGQCGTATSSAATLTVNSAPSISNQPANTTVCAGSNAVFSVTATGSGLSYQWQLNTGSGFNNITGANASSYTVTGVTLGQNGHLYQVIVSGTCGSPVTSSVATLTVGNSAAITADPQSATVCVGANPVNFSVTATGSSLTYQWQVNTGSGFTNITGATAATYNAGPATAAQNGYQYRVNVFSCTPTPITSAAATLTVNTPAAITTEPVASTLCEGSNASFSVVAVGTAIGYQWQVSTTGCAGTFTNIAGATAATLAVNAVTASQNGYAYRVVITNSCNTVTSNCVTLTVNTAIVVTTQPASTSVCLPTTTAQFNVAVTGTAPTYQWQVNTGSGFSNISGATAATLNLTGLTAAMNGYQYRVVLSGTCSNSFNSDAATLTVNSPVAITDQPDDVIICEADNASFSVAATGSTITYQWQARKNGGPFANVPNTAPYSGATTATLNITNATAAISGFEYRVIVSGVPCGAVNSDTVSLTVNALPGVVLVAAEHNQLTPYTPTGLYSTVSPAGSYTYTWYRDGGVVPGQTSSAIAPATIDWFGQYYVTVTDANGCSKNSNTVTLSDKASKLLFIYPNPSTGVFQVRYYTTSPTEFSLNVYDEKGARVWSKKYAANARYEQMLVNLGRNAQGTYTVEVKAPNGKRLAAGRVVIQR